ncbi:MAG: CoA-binding protein [Dehalococcoidales bacterium]|nr:CoA-binding protein [Dehalococcoidales bacterium]
MQKTSIEFHDADFWRALFEAESIAVVGARKTPGTWGYDALKSSIVTTGINKDCRVYAVNPKEKTILGIPCYESVLAIPGDVDLAIIVVPAAATPGVYKQCAEKKIKAAIIITAGFAEVDEDGKKLQEELVAISREANIPFIGPNCIGHSDLYTRVGSAGFAGTVDPGSIAIASQSGTLVASIIQSAGKRGLGLSKFVSTGNEAVTHMEDCLEYLGQDKSTKIIAVYIEGLREARRFFELAQKISPHKPIIAMKSGGTGQAAQAAHSHTGAMSGSDIIYTAAFKQSGVIRVEDEDELMDVAFSLQNTPLPAGNRVAILTIGGGFGVVTAEVCEREGLKIARLERQTLDKLSSLFPSRWNPGNPVDMVGVRSGDNNLAMQLYRIIMEDHNVDTIFSLLPPMSGPRAGMDLKPEQIEAMMRQGEKDTAELQELIFRYQKPVFFITRITFKEDDKSSQKVTIPQLPHPRRAARVVRYLTQYRRYLEDRNLL